MGQAPVRVVLAEDAPDTRALLAAVLAGTAGVELVGVAEDGAQAVRLVRTSGADAVVLDLAMPRMDGLEAAAAIRAAQPHIRIIVVSGYSTGGMSGAALAAGADRYVEKSAGAGAVVAALGELFAGVGAARRRPEPAAGPGRASGVEPAVEPGGESGVESGVEQRYRLLLDALEEGVLVVEPAAPSGEAGRHERADAAPVVVEANFAASRILGVPTSTLLGRALPAPLAEAAAPSLADGWPRSNLGLRLPGPDGDRRLIVSVRPLSERGRALISMIAATDAVPGEVVLLLSASGTVEHAPAASRLVLGYPASGLLGRSLYELLDPDDVPELRRAHRAALRSSEGFAAEHRVLRGDGSVLWCRTELRRVPGDSGRSGLRATLRDVTGHRAAERAWQQATEWFEAALAALPDPVVVFDAVHDSAGRVVDFRVREANPAALDGAAAALGWLGPAARGRSVHELLPEAERRKLLDVFARVMATGLAASAPPSATVSPLTDGVLVVWRRCADPLAPAPA